MLKFIAVSTIVCVSAFSVSAEEARMTTNEALDALIPQAKVLDILTRDIHQCENSAEDSKKCDGNKDRVFDAAMTHKEIDRNMIIYGQRMQIQHGFVPYYVMEDVEVYMKASQDHMAAIKQYGLDVRYGIVK